MTTSCDEGRFPGWLLELSVDPGSLEEEPRSRRVAQGLMGPAEGCGPWRGGRSLSPSALGLGKAKCQRKTWPIKCSCCVSKVSSQIPKSYRPGVDTIFITSKENLSADLVGAPAKGQGQTAPAVICCASHTDASLCYCGVNGYQAIVLINCLLVLPVHSSSQVIPGGFGTKFGSQQPGLRFAILVVGFK